MITNQPLCLVILLSLVATHSVGFAAETDGPGVRNVLFIVADDLRASVLGCYGDELCKTPNIDRLAREGVLFERAYCQGTLCGPSRTSFMYSRYRGTGNVTLGEHLRRHGRYSARAGKIFHMRVPGDIIAGTNGQDVAACWTERFNSQGNEAHTPGDYACLNQNIFTTALPGRQSTRMPHRMFVSVQYDGDGSDQPDHKTATKTIELLREHQDEPYFLAAGFVRPHYPMVAPRKYFKQYPFDRMRLPKTQPGDLEDIPKKGISKSRSALNGIEKYPDNQKRMWSAYYAAVAFMDEQLGRILDELDRLDLRDSTAIVFTSDHGYHLGDHTFWQKNNLHEQVIRVPLIISLPGAATGRSNAIVELVDLFPTACEMTGVPVPSGLHGKSLMPILQDPRASIRDYAISFASGTSLRSKDWAYMRYNDGAEELYDMRSDPMQFENLALEADQEGRVSNFRAMLKRKMKDVGLDPPARR